MRFSVPAALGEQRVDRVVAILTELPRAVVTQAIDRGEVLVDGEVVKKASQKVAAHSEVTFEIPDIETQQLTPDDSVDFEVVYEDHDILVINKPAGLTVHPGNGVRGATLVNGLLARYPELATTVPGGDPLRPGIVHRLDSGTSGLMIVALTESAHASLVEALSEHGVVRNYLALVWGHPEHAAGIVDAPIGRSARDRTLMAVAQDGKHAVTNYRVVTTVEDPAVSLLAVGLETGRTHQIRVHMKALGHPIVGDARYGGLRGVGQGDGAFGDLARPFLHAFRLGFDHPVSATAMSFEVQMPAELAGVANGLGIELAELPEAPEAGR